MIERQAGRDFPYPPRVEGTGPWMDDNVIAEDAMTGSSEATEEASRAARVSRRQSRSMYARPADDDTDALRPEEMNRGAPVPDAWEQVFTEQGNFIEELLGEA